MQIPEGYSVACESSVVSPVDLHIDLKDFNMVITPTEKKKQTLVEVVGLVSEYPAEGLSLLFNIKNHTNICIATNIRADKKSINRAYCIAEHITNFLGKLTNKYSSSDKLIIATPYRGIKDKDYNKTVVNISLMEELSVKEHLTCALNLTPEFLEWMEDEFKRTITDNRFVTKF